MASGELGEEGEIGRRLGAERGNGHQARKLQRRRTNGADELAEILDPAAALLLFLADIDLNVDVRGTCPLLRFFDERVEERAPVKGMDGAEEHNRLSRLVRLKAADAVEAHIGEPLEQRRPFRERLLDAVLPEVALSSSDQRLDLFSRAPLADSDQLDIGGIALRNRSCPGDSPEDLFASLCSAAHPGRYRNGHAPPPDRPEAMADHSLRR